jgi:HEPN domain-containing protein
VTDLAENPRMFAQQDREHTMANIEPRPALGTHHLEVDPTVDPLSRFGSRVRALVWPTRTLVGSERWFDELYVWTADFEPDRSLRAQIQLAALEHAFSMLEHERVERVAVTLSFGSVERSLEALVRTLDTHRLTAHRLSILLRGAMERLRWPYRVREFIDFLRSYQVPVGYRFAEPRASMEMSAIDFVAPDFAKMLAPISVREETWFEMSREVNALGLTRETFVLAGIEREEQLRLAKQTGFVLGQGRALKKPYFPPRVMRPR